MNWTLSEIAALLAIIGTLGGCLAWLIRQHHLSTFVTKKAYYAQREADAVAAEKAAAAAKETKDQEDSETKAHREAMIGKVEEMNKNLASFMLSLAGWKGEVDKRVSILEDRSSLRRTVRRGGSGR